MIEVNWDTDERRAVRVTFVQCWTWEDVARTGAAAHALTAASAHPVFYIMDYADETARVHIPLNALRHVISMQEPLPAHVRGIIVVNPTRAARNLIAVMQHLYPPFKQAFVYCSTLKEARACIQQALANDAGQPEAGTSRSTHDVMWQGANTDD